MENKTYKKRRAIGFKKIDVKIHATQMIVFILAMFTLCVFKLLADYICCI